MSRDNVRGVCGGYKGIENFLRRMAFNLGNTPSETEVKIISCIPIDVTDLQQKIADLEKQLEEAEGANNSIGARKSPSPKRMSVTKEPSPTGKSKALVAEEPPRPDSRSIVANPVVVKNPLSQASVTVQFECSGRDPINSFLYSSAPRNGNLVATDSKISTDKHGKYKYLKKNIFCKNKYYNTKKKNMKTQLVYYAEPHSRSPFNDKLLAETEHSKTNSKNAHGEEIYDCNDGVLYFSHILNKQYMPRPALHDLSNASEFSSPVCRDNVTCRTSDRNELPYESDVCSCCRGPFQNLDQHMSPAHKFDLYPTFTDKENDNKYAYYDSSAYDVIPVKEKHYCSFQNKNAEDFDFFNRRDFRRHVDMNCWPERVRPKIVPPTVPTSVREGKKKQHRVSVNYHTVVPTRYHLNMKTNNRKNKKDIILNKMAATRPIMTHYLNLNRNPQDSKICDVDLGQVYAKNKKRKFLPKPVKFYNASCSTTILNNSECQTGMEPSASLVDDKTTATLNQIKVILQSVLTEVKTKAKLTSHSEPKKDAVVQNGLSQSNICGGSHLLNSFTYSQFNTNPYLASCSRPMPSNNYCPPNVPYTGAKYIQQYPLFVQSNRPLCSSCEKGHVSTTAMATAMPTQPAPPTSGAAAAPAAVLSTRHPISTATNTDRAQDRSQETKQLIKDIYNSLALNIDNSNKKTTLKQGDQNTNSKMYLIKTETEKEMNRRTDLSEIFKNPNLLNTSVTGKLTPFCKLTSTETTFRSGYNTNTDTIKASPVNKHIVNNKQGVYEEPDSDEQSDDVNEEADATATATATDPSTSADDDDDDDDDDDEDTARHLDGPVAAEQSSKKQERKGLLSKMFKLFTPKNRKPKQSVQQVNESETDSDEYQTVYSQKVTLKPNKEARKVQEARKVHLPLHNQGITFKNQRIMQASPDRYRRAPYMEQEYRRYWDEKLLFQDRYAKQSTEASRTTPQVAAGSRSVYRQKYEARSALVEANRRFSTTTTAGARAGADALQQVYRPPPQARRTSYTTSRTSGNKQRVASKGLAWLKKHKLGLQSGNQLKKVILEG